MDDFLRRTRAMRYALRRIWYQCNVFLNYTLRRFFLLARVPKQLFAFLKKSIILAFANAEKRFTRLPLSVRLSAVILGAAILIIGLAYGTYRMIPSAEERRDRFFARGKYYYDRGEYPEALIEFKNAAQISPGFAPAHYYAALTNIYLCRLKEAAAGLYACARIDPGNKNAILKLNAVQTLLKDPTWSSYQAQGLPERGSPHLNGRLLMSKVLILSGDVREALADVQKAYAGNPDSYEINIIMGDISIAQRNFEKAKAHYQKALRLQPASFEATFKIGNLYLYDNDFGAALREFENASRLSPDNPVVYTMMGDCHAYLNQYDAAIEKYKKAYEADKRFLKPLKNICNMLVFRGKLDEAAPYVEEFAEKAPDDPDALLTRAIIRYARKDVEGAFNDIQRSLKARKGSFLAHYMYGKMLASAGRYAEARDELLAAIRINSRMSDPHNELAEVYIKLREGAKALKEAERALALNPHDQRAKQIRGRAYLEMKDYERAQSCFEEMQKVHPLRPEGYYYMGVLQQQKKRLSLAVKAYLNALGRDINYLPAFYPLLDLYMRTRNYDKAVRLCDKMLRVHPDNPSIQEAAGRVLVMLGKNDEAVKFYEKAVDLNPGQIDARRALVELYLAQGLHMNALQQCDELLRHRPDDPQLLQKTAQIYQILGNRQRALEYYEKALSRAFDYVSANNAAWLYAAEEKDLDRALKLALKAEAESKQVPQVVDTVAWVLIRMGKYDDAIARLRMICENERRNPLFAYHLGLAYYKKGAYADAARYLRRSLDSSRKFDSAPDALKMLQELESKGYK